MTTTTTEYGFYTHGKPVYSGETWRRTDRWVAYYNGDTGHDWLFASGQGDDSPIFQGQYDAGCSCCWLGCPHTENVHTLRLLSRTGQRRNPEPH